MDAGLRQYLEGMEERMKGAIDASEERMKALIDGRLDASEERLKDFIRKADFDLETKLIAEFWKWGRGSDAAPDVSVFSYLSASEANRF